MAQNQKWQKTLCSFLYPWAFFERVCHVSHIISTSNIYFGDILIFSVILSYIAAGYDHFRSFYRNLKNDHFSLKNPCFSRKNRIFLCLDWNINMIEESRNKNLLRNTFDLLLLIFLNVFFQYFNKIEANYFDVFSDFCGKIMDFLAKNDHFQISIK